jgi:hypothetical protein
MSPEFSIEPGRLVGAQGLSQLLSDTVLAQSADGEGDGVAHGRAELIGQGEVQFLLLPATSPSQVNGTKCTPRSSARTTITLRRIQRRPTFSSC